MFVTLAAVTVLLAVQTPSASITGTVLEEGSSAPVPGAVVILTDLDRAETTDSSGRYTFRDVPPGPQHVAVRLLGYASRTLHALVPRQGGVVINIALRPEAVELPAIAARHRVPVRGVEKPALPG